MLPDDTAQALAEMDMDANTAPLTMPPSFYTHRGMLPTELECLFLPV